MGARVKLEVQEPLVGLLKSLTGVSRVIPDLHILTALEDFDYHCPLMSLPFALKTTIDTMPFGKKYLYSDSVKVAEWRTKLGPKKKPRVGLAWSGNPMHRDDHNRIVLLSDLIPHLPTGFSVCVPAKRGPRY